MTTVLLHELSYTWEPALKRRKGEQRYSSTLSLTSPLDGSGWSTSSPTSLPLGNEPTVAIPATALSAVFAASVNGRLSWTQRPCPRHSQDVQFLARLGLEVSVIIRRIQYLETTPKKYSKHSRNNLFLSFPAAYCFDQNSNDIFNTVNPNLMQIKAAVTLDFI
jgi:hypothetical protein